MNINRHNYEEFFILYMDNELSSEDRREVELFVEAHPDLKEELEMLQQAQFSADDTVTFDNKESLLRFADCDITTSNYDEWLVLYIDNELTLKQRVIVESFVMNNSVAKAELEILKKTKLQPVEAIVFPDKESLYRQEETTRRVVVIRWWRIAAAAVLLFAVATGGFLVFNNKTIPPSIAQEGQKDNEVKTNNTTKLASETSKETRTIQPVTDNDIKQPVTAEVKTDQVAVRPTNKQNNNTVEGANNVEQQNNAISNSQQSTEVAGITTNNTTRGNNLPVPTSNHPNMDGKMENRASLATNTTSLTELKQTDAILAVTYNTPSTLNSTEGNDEEAQPEKKNKLRGIFRTIARTIEKKTNIKATDENNRLLIGGLAIKL